jgi:hypothetical protein
MAAVRSTHGSTKGGSVRTSAGLRTRVQSGSPSGHSMGAWSSAVSPRQAQTGSIRICSSRSPGPTAAGSRARVPAEPRHVA